VMLVLNQEKRADLSFGLPFRYPDPLRILFEPNNFL